MMAFLMFLQAAAAAPQPGPADPLLPARWGQLQCYAPDPARKTCGSLAAYRPDGAQHYVNRAEIPLAPDGSMTMTTTTAVRIVAGTVCGTIGARDVARAEVRVAGTPLAAAQAAPLLSQVAQAFAPMIGHEICTRYEPDGAGFVARASVDGVARPSLDQRVIWVAPADGWRVAAPPGETPEPDPAQSPG
jgi:hypothetical protein